MRSPEPPIKTSHPMQLVEVRIMCHPILLRMLRRTKSMVCCYSAALCLQQKKESVSSLFFPSSSFCNIHIIYRYIYVYVHMVALRSMGSASFLPSSSFTTVFLLLVVVVAIGLRCSQTHTHTHTHTTNHTTLHSQPTHTHGTAKLKAKHKFLRTLITPEKHIEYLNQLKKHKTT